MATKKRKLISAITAVAVSAAILLGGTYAWQSISQQALNEKIVEVNPGGRLHDDYDGTNKDVYVENFGDTPIFARVRLDEYMEIGAGAGLKTGAPDYDSKKATPVKVGTDINDMSTWVTHIPAKRRRTTRSISMWSGKWADLPYICRRLIKTRIA